jgi:hypothetical protein
MKATIGQTGPLVTVAAENADQTLFQTLALTTTTTEQTILSAWKTRMIWPVEETLCVMLRLKISVL